MRGRLEGRSCLPYLRSHQRTAIAMVRRRPVGAGIVIARPLVTAIALLLLMLFRPHGLWPDRKA